MGKLDAYDYDFFYKEYVINDKSSFTLANELNCDQRTVSRYMKKIGILVAKKVKRNDYETIKQAFESKGYTLLDLNYKNNHDKLKYKCHNHPDEDLNIRWNDFQKGVGCPFCARTAKLKFEDVKKEFEKRGYKLLEKEYINSRTKMRYKCPKHPNKSNSITISDLKNGGYGCPYCAGNIKYTFEEVKKVFDEKGYNLLEKEYINSQTGMKYICLKHFKEVQYVRFNDIKNGHGCYECGLDKLRGENNWNYNPDLTDRDREEKRCFEGYQKWRNLVYERDHYRCKCCGDNKGGNLNAHHLDGYNWCIEKRTDIDNGITLCEDCHTGFHNTYGYGNNTKEQFDQYIKQAK